MPSEDFFLRLVVRRVEDSDFRTGISLTVGGMLLQGDMISEQEFFEGFANHITGDTPELRAEHRAYYSSVPEALEEVGQQEASLSAERRAFIHLKNVQILVGETDWARFGEATYWRGKIASVDGFWLGRTTLD